ncbi:arylamine N-acetyltransferase [Virgibacillus phasianinus]|uniref:Arylamine N-acetyltransferase n=2 Tax=Virgibacillus phasianinus TaxID=2017483 RepID=A0A220U8L1_9BACI|nr:arylamine N-acetyltransferase [Virgibacillus phasianinus]
MKVEQYLKRISTNNNDISLKTLNHLQLQHMLHVPFENLDVIHQIPIALDVETYYRKIVINHRGGFCYELNGLFNWLLQRLGFNSRIVSATVQRPDGSWAFEGSHACLIVELDQPYLVDVGFGDSARFPLPLTGEARKDISGTYRLMKVQDGIYDLQRQNKNEWDTLYRLDTKGKKLAEFEDACQFNQTSPESHFTQKKIVSIATSNGRVTLSGNSLILTHNGERQKTKVEAGEEPTVLKKYFDIKL